MTSRRGSMLMEYAVLVGTLAVTLAVIMTEFYDSTTGTFGDLGRRIVWYFQGLVTVVSLPVP